MRDPPARSAAAERQERSRLHRTLDLRPAKGVALAATTLGELAHLRILEPDDIAGDAADLGAGLVMGLTNLARLSAEQRARCHKRDGDDGRSGKGTGKSESKPR